MSTHSRHSSGASVVSFRLGGKTLLIPGEDKDTPPATKSDQLAALYSSGSDSVKMNGPGAPSHGATPHSAAPHSAAPHSAAPHSAAPHSAAPEHSTSTKEFDRKLSSTTMDSGKSETDTRGPGSPDDCASDIVTLLRNTQKPQAHGRE
ncbi:uncharacterized protein LOC131947893 [Physella acuta]|uniref:uncharacterized protein LOC131947893 n=1 Tax=Physella acuta TaxID=109671 RepID=UPI0027DC5FB4|nr:uncharacterized protein LOC131947893 [Physella acuta]